MIGGAILAFLPEGLYKFFYVKFASMHWSAKAAALLIIIVFVYQVLGATTLPFVYIEF
jgi:hypothetical protein